jgi:hypothetical protein
VRARGRDCGCPVSYLRCCARAAKQPCQLLRGVPARVCRGCELHDVWEAPSRAAAAVGSAARVTAARTQCRGAAVRPPGRCLASPPPPAVPLDCPQCYCHDVYRAVPPCRRCPSGTAVVGGSVLRCCGSLSTCPCWGLGRPQPVLCRGFDVALVLLRADECVACGRRAVLRCDGFISPYASFCVAVSTVTRGRHMVKIMNNLGVHYACIGNHDLGERLRAHLPRRRGAVGVGVSPHSCALRTAHHHQHTQL